MIILMIDTPLGPNMGVLKTRKIPAIISHPRPNITKEPEQYYRNLLLLFMPWRHKKDILADCSTYEQSFKKGILRNSALQEYESKLSIQQATRDGSGTFRRHRFGTAVSAPGLFGARTFFFRFVVLKLRCFGL